MVRKRRALQGSERSSMENKLLQSPRALHSLLDAMVATNAMPALCAKDANIRADKHFMLDLIKAHLASCPELVAMRQVGMAWSEKPAPTNNVALSPSTLATYNVLGLIARPSQPSIAAPLELTDPFVC